MLTHVHPARMIAAAAIMLLATASVSSAASPQLSGYAYAAFAPFNYGLIETDLRSTPLVQGDATDGVAFAQGANLPSEAGTLHVAPIDRANRKPHGMDLIYAIEGFAADSRSVATPPTGVQSSASVGKASFRLQRVFANHMSAAPDLVITAVGATARTAFDGRVPGHEKNSGKAALGSLSITGSLVGGKKIAFSGSAKPNTVLFKSANLIVTVGDVTQNTQLDCSSGTCVAVTGQSVIALRVRVQGIELNNPGDATQRHAVVNGEIQLAVPFAI